MSGVSQFIHMLQDKKNKALAKNIEIEFKETFNIELDGKIKEAISSIRRDFFIPDAFKHLAYETTSLPIETSQWISSPLTIAIMIQSIDYNNVDNILEIGSGSGYQAAILSKIFKRVYTVERIYSLFIKSKQNFKNCNITNINSRYTDGSYGWPSFSPYNRIIVSASSYKVPQKLFDQLDKRGGILIAPIKKRDKNIQIITKFTKHGAFIDEEEISPCFFVDLKEGTSKDMS